MEIILGTSQANCGEWEWHPPTNFELDFEQIAGDGHIVHVINMNVKGTNSKTTLPLRYELVVVIAIFCRHHVHNVFHQLLATYQKLARYFATRMRPWPVEISSSSHHFIQSKAATGSPPPPTPSNFELLIVSMQIASKVRSIYYSPIAKAPPQSSVARSRVSSSSIRVFRFSIRSGL